MTRDETFAQSKKLTDAALEHAANAGDPEYAPGDLEILLAVALPLVPDDRLGEFWADPSVAEPAEIDEYEAFLGPRDACRASASARVVMPAAESGAPAQGPFPSTGGRGG